MRFAKVWELLLPLDSDIERSKILRFISLLIIAGASIFTFMLVDEYF